MPSQSENLADRDARLEKAALERDRAVALLRRWVTRQCRIDTEVFDGNLVTVGDETAEFLESMT